MKKFISTSLAFLCIMTSSASFPNQLSAVESKSNVKFYLKSASNIVSDILCTILTAFIASAIFKSRAESPISIIPDNDNIPLSSNPSLPTTEISQSTISDSKEEKQKQEEKEKRIETNIQTIKKQQ